MTAPNPEQRALRPLWMLATGATIGASIAALSEPPPSPLLGWTLLGVGLTAS